MEGIKKRKYCNRGGYILYRLARESLTRMQLICLFVFLTQMLDLATFISDSLLAHFPTKRKIFPQIITLSFSYLQCFIDSLWLSGWFYYLNLAHKVCTDLAPTNLISTISGFTVEMYSTTCILLQNE